MRVAIIVGHDKTSPGAWSPFLRATEYIYNSEVATYLHGVADVYKRPMGGGYTTQMRKLSAQLNPMDYDLVAELHFNKFDNKNNDKGVGCEAVVYPGNDYSHQAGKIYCDMVSSEYQINNRGVKEHGPGNRGYGFLSLMEAPAIIVEPFFGDEDEAEKFENPGKYAELIKNWIKCL